MVNFFIYNVYIFICITIIYIESKVVKILLFRTISTFNIKSMIGTSEEIKIFELNLYSPHTFSASSYYHPSSIAKLISSGVANFDKVQNVEYKLLSENITFIESDLYMNEFNYLYIRDFVYEYDTLSLAYSSRNSNTNIVRKLYNDNVIDKMQFAIYSESNYEENVYLYLGGFPENKQPKKYYTKLAIDKTFQGWSPQLNKVIIGEHEYINNHKGYFQLIKSGIYAPSSFIDFIVGILKEDFDNGKCKMVYDSIGLLSCECDVFEKIPNITFYFGNTQFSFGKDFLVITGINECILNIEKGNKKDDLWRFDYSFMNYFDILFDYEDGAITFYSDSPFQEEISVNYAHNYIKLIFIFVLTILIINSIILIVNKK